jgi:Tfp pilus assembly protein PilN
MLRINLLPPYIHDKNKKLKLGVVWIAAVVALMVLLLAANGSAHGKLAEANDRKTTAQNFKTTTDDLIGKIHKEEDARAEIEKKQTFVRDARKYNDSWPESFETIRDVTPTNTTIILKSMAIDPGSRKTITLNGWGTSEEAVVRWWMSLRNNTDLFDHVNFQLPVHAWPPGAKSNSMGGPGGPSSGGQPNAGVPMQGNLSSTGGGGRGPRNGGPSSGGGGGSKEDEVGPASLRGKQGLNFVAAISLKKALADGIATPSWPPGSAPAAGGGGMPSAPGGGPMSGGKMNMSTSKAN